MCVCVYMSICMRVIVGVCVREELRQLCIYFEPGPVGRSMSESTFSGRPCSFGPYRGLSFFQDSSTNTCSLNIVSSLGIHLHDTRQSLLRFCVSVPFFTQHATMPVSFHQDRERRRSSSSSSSSHKRKSKRGREGRDCSSSTVSEDESSKDSGSEDRGDVLKRLHTCIMHIDIVQHLFIRMDCFAHLETR
jgi:hypothetical protein